MSIIYKCRHCSNVIGELVQQGSYTSKLGWDTLSNEEKQEMIHHQQNGDIHIQSICDNCEQALEKHPEYHELDFFIQ